MIKTDNKNHIIPDSSLSMKSDNSISECKRCGTCCKKGGPCFHVEDKMLIEKGVILIKYLYNIRKGESAYDNIKGCLIPVTSELIKIKGIYDILGYDDSIRELVVKKGKMDPENLDFLFGRPVVATIRMFGLNLS